VATTPVIKLFHRNYRCTAVAKTALQLTQYSCSGTRARIGFSAKVQHYFYHFQTANAKEFFKQDMLLPNRMFEETDNVMFDILSAATVPK